MLEKIYHIFQSYEAQPLGIDKYYAVLIPLVVIDEELYILYESRAAGISQGGDTSFPGGRVEEGESFKEAAVRETVEELGLTPDKIALLGEMDYVVERDRVIACFVAQLNIDSLEDLAVNPDEVAYPFLVPFMKLFRQETKAYTFSHELQIDADFPYEKIPGGKAYPFRNRQVTDQMPFYDVDDEVLWGLTARLTERLMDIVRTGEADIFSGKL